MIFMSYKEVSRYVHISFRLKFTVGYLHFHTKQIYITIILLFLLVLDAQIVGSMINTLSLRGDCAMSVSFIYFVRN